MKNVAIFVVFIAFFCCISSGADSDHLGYHDYGQREESVAGSLDRLRNDPPAQYTLTIDQDAPNSGTLRLSLANPLSSEIHAFTRVRSDTYLQEPFCENLEKELILSDSGWLVPGGCSEIVWVVRFNTVNYLAHNLSQQINIYHPSGWWLYSEWGSLLRLEGKDTVSTLCATVGAEALCRDIPSSSEPPLLMPIGKPTLTSDVSGISVQLFIGNLPSDFSPKRLLRMYESQFRYLQSVVAQRIDASVPGAIDIVVLGIDGDHGSSGGAAGKNSILANLIVEDSQVSDSETVRLLWITGHEFAHMVGLGTQALWASESLAHYYGYKSVQHHHLSTTLFRAMSDGLDEIGLIEANRRVENGQGEYYRLFYSKGAYFWRELDILIATKTKGHGSLDDYLPLLIKGDFGISGELPQEFVNEIQRVIGASHFSEIVKDYL